VCAPVSSRENEVQIPPLVACAPRGRRFARDDIIQSFPWRVFVFASMVGDAIMKSVPEQPEAASRLRKSHEPPDVVARRGWRYHHLGIPTDVPRAGEIYLERFGLYVSGFPTSPYGIEWMRFAASSPLHPLIKSLPHVAFEVDDLDAALIGQQVISPPGSPSDSVRAAMIVVDGAPVELIWFRKEGS